MGRVKARIDVPGIVSTAEALWYDTHRWPAFVDGLAHVASVGEGWPRKRGSRVLWDSPPKGRGRVREEVLSYEARVGQTAHVEDESLRGTQTVRFEARGEGVTRITLELDYELKRDGITAPLIDLLFTRRPVRDALQRTLRRFARELRSDREFHA